MGGGLVLFGIGGGSVSGGLVDAITGSSGGGDTGTERFLEARARGAASARRPTRRTRPPGPRSPARASRPRGVGENFDPNTSTYTGAGKAQARRPPRVAWEQVPRARPEEARRPRRDADGPARSADGAEQARRGRRRRRRSSPTPARSRDLRPARVSPTRPARPARATSPPTKALELADPDQREDAQGPARRRRSSRPRSARSSRTPRRRRPRRRAEAGVRQARSRRLQSAPRALVAQLAEQRTLNPKVPGSIPGGGIDERPASRAFRRFWVAAAGYGVPNRSREGRVSARVARSS